MTTLFALAALSLAPNPSTGTAESPTALNTRFSFTASIPAVPAGAKVVDFWIPIPRDDHWQRVTNLKVNSSLPWKITEETKFGNRMIHVRGHRSSKPVDVKFSVDVHRRRVHILNGEDTPEFATSYQIERHLKADRLVPVGGRYAKMAGDLSVGKSDPLEKMRSFFNFAVDNMQYDYKKESPKRGMGDVAFVCDYKKGNCTDLHSYLISMARNEAIPSYLEFGLAVNWDLPPASPVPTEGKVSGYHCWEWFYIYGRGWIPLDAATARQYHDKNNPEMRAAMFGSLPLYRASVAVSHGRDITLVPAQKGEPLNYFNYPYAEVDGKKVDTKWDVEYKILSVED